MRLATIAKMVVTGWVHEQRVTISEQQRAIITDAFARTLQSIQDEERKGYRDLITAAIETCEQHGLDQGTQVLRSVLEADVESEARQDS